MPAPNLPNALLKLGVAVAKHYLKKVIGDEVVQEIATMLTDVSEEEIKAKIDSILTNKEGQKQLLKAARSADQCFKKKCKDKDLRELFTMAHGDLSSVQTAIAGLPEAVDDEIFRETLFKVFRSELPKRVSNDRVNEGITLYIECLQSALVPIKEFGLRVLHTELREIGKDVKDIKADVKLLLEKTKTDSQSLTGSTNRSDDRIRQEMDLLELPLVYGGFYGRDNEFVAIEDLVSSLKGKQKLLSVTGFGGVGKTAFVRTFAERTSMQFSGGVLGVSMGKVENSDIFFRRLADFYGLGINVIQKQDVSYREIAACVLKQSSLIILDGFEVLRRRVENSDPSAIQLVRSIRTLIGGNSILITTTRELAGWPEEIAFVLAPLSPEEGAGVFKSATAQHRKSSIETEDAQKISIYLGGHTLGIRLLAGAYGNMTITTAQFLERIEKILPKAQDILASPDYQNTLDSCWAYSIEALTDDRLFKLLRNLTIFLSPVPDFIVSMVFENKEIPDLLQELWTRSLLERQESGELKFYELHPTLRLYLIQHGQAEKGKNTTSQYRATFLSVVSVAYQSYDLPLGLVQLSRICLPDIENAYNLTTQEEERPVFPIKFIPTFAKLIRRLRGNADARRILTPLANMRIDFIVFTEIDEFNKMMLYAGGGDEKEQNKEMLRLYNKRQALTEVAEMAFSEGDLTQSLDLYKELSEWAGIADPNTKTLAQIKIAQIYELLNDTNNCEDAFRKAVSIGENWGRIITFVEAITEFGLYFVRQGNLESAWEMYNRIDNLRENFQKEIPLHEFEEADTPDIRLAKSEANIGLSLRPTFRKYLDQDGKVLQLRLKAAIHFDENEPNLLFSTLESAIDLVNQENNPLFVSLLFDLARAHSVYGEINSALKIYDDIVQISQESLNREDEAEAITGAADIHFSNGELEKANEFYGQAHSLYTKIGFAKGSLQTISGLARTQLLMRDATQAIATIIPLIEKFQSFPTYDKEVRKLLIGFRRYIGYRSFEAIWMECTNLPMPLWIANQKEDEPESEKQFPIGDLVTAVEKSHKNPQDESLRLQLNEILERLESLSEQEKPMFTQLRSAIDMALSHGIDISANIVKPNISSPLFWCWVDIMQRLKPLTTQKSLETLIWDTIPHMLQFADMILINTVSAMTNMKDHKKEVEERLEWMLSSFFSRSALLHNRSGSLADDQKVLINAALSLIRGDQVENVIFATSPSIEQYVWQGILVSIDEYPSRSRLSALIEASKVLDDLKLSINLFDVLPNLLNEVKFAIASIVNMTENEKDQENVIAFSEAIQSLLDQGRISHPIYLLQPLANLWDAILGYIHRRLILSIQLENLIDSTIRIQSKSNPETSETIEAKTIFEQQIAQMSEVADEDAIEFFTAVLALLNDKTNRQVLSEPKWNELLQAMYYGLENKDLYYSETRRMRSFAINVLGSYVNVLYGADSYLDWSEAIVKDCEDGMKGEGTDLLRQFFQWIKDLIRDESMSNRQVANESSEDVVVFNELKTILCMLDLPYSYNSDVVNPIYVLSNPDYLVLWLWQSGVKRTESEHFQDSARRDFVDRGRQLLVAKYVSGRRFPESGELLPETERNLNTPFNKGWQRILNTFTSP